ncbi:hypothetical protein GGI25_004992 [Coemansia spiralis]|uniref:Carbohydrate-binding module family 96 domain-containing protein n=2 Tax=Coemansia TaxID=4863 RepID=A0A9W8FZE0_9FUNG|nr:hypothetical protein BX070DRAFT_223883 [Coemansia spiralis]KAJ1989193.1 hypothetical protein EDC05_004849 [Coemansia umbellata]KAJ2620147.1 hypothetical protein GGI26_005262 [Coemansia sp. RSA 1358]KAJ2672674.1 hypothetical protein GGI25_004992 [Coemansia spiralis]
MRPVNYLNVIHCFIYLAECAAVKVTDIKATKDATVDLSTDVCGDTVCALVSHGMEPTVSTSEQNGGVVRILLGFELPSGISNSDDITQCQLQMQAPIQAPDGQYYLQAFEAGGDWDEATINGASGVKTGNALGDVKAASTEVPGPIDVTDACKAAAGGPLSLWLDTNGSAVTFPSANTGAAARLRIFT